MSAGFTGAKPNNNAGGTAAFTAYIESGAASIPTSPSACATTSRGSGASGG